VWALVVAALVFGQSSTPREVITAIQIHGNTLTPDDEVRRLAGVAAGTPFGPDTIDRVTEQLHATGRFKSIDVLKRFASISDPSQILLVIVVDEGPVHIEMTGDPAHPTRVVKSRGPRLLFLPVLGAEDGYGASYGVRLALPDPAGKRSRLAFPLTWGGVKRAGAEFEKRLPGAPIDRVTAGAAVSRITNPFFERDDDRVRAWARGEREIVHGLRVGGTGGWQRASFDTLEDEFVQVGADAIVDTRVDPSLPRNAVYLRSAWDHLQFLDHATDRAHTTGGRNRVDLDARGYVGLFRQNIFALRAQRQDSDRPLPPYLQPLLGGMASLRGFRAGTAAGDTLVATSAELIVPLSPALGIGKVGVSGFVDYATIYAKGERLADQTMQRGIGGSVWFTAAFVHFSVAVAHGRGGSTRVHVGGDVSF
jgi:surface antigen Omp85-like protein/surface antigen-like variable number repeat protein